MAILITPSYGVTGVHWPTSGTVPMYNDTCVYTIEKEPGTPNGYILRAKAPLTDLTPGSGMGADHQRIFAGTFVVIPSLTTGNRIYHVNIIQPNVDGDTPPGTYAFISFNGREPSSLANNVVTDLYVIQGPGIPCKVYNTGTTNTPTINGAPVLASQTGVKMTWPFEYVAAGVGDQLAFDLKTGR